MERKSTRTQVPFLIKLFSITALLFLAFSCSEDDTTNMIKYGGKMIVTVDGEEFKVEKNGIYVSQGNFSFEGRSKGPQIEMSIFTGIAETTYELDPG